MGTVQQLVQLDFSPNQAKHLAINGTDLLLGGWTPATYINSNASEVLPLTATYASATSFTVPGDITGQINLGMPVRFVQPTAGIKFGNVAAKSYSAPSTTITLFANNSYDVVNEAITSLSFSYYDRPYDFPTRFAYTTTLGAQAGTVTNPVRLITEFVVDGGFIELWLSCGLDLGTAPAAFLTYTLPVGGFAGADFQWFGVAKINNTGATEANGIFFINTTGSTGRVYRSAAAAWPIGAGHTWNGNIKYRWA